MNRKIFFSLLVGVSVIAETAFAQISGGIDDAMMQGIKMLIKIHRQTRLYVMH